MRVEVAKAPLQLVGNSPGPLRNDPLIAYNRDKESKRVVVDQGVGRLVQG